MAYSAKILRVGLHPASLTRCFTTKLNLENYDATQVQLMKEECIGVDENDKVVSKLSKMDSHLMEKGPPLHRAFSLFIFNSDNQLLMQKRANLKITFPGYYTNSCCSHPLFTFMEFDEKDAIGVKRAAQRRALYELGIPKQQLPVSSINYLTRVHYKAPCSQLWGEHEIDYVLFAQSDVDLSINTNEVSEVQWVSLDNLDEFFEKCSSSRTPITPWFHLIAKSKLRLWWSNLHQISKLSDHETITRF